jgi:hypothetical protein
MNLETVTVGVKLGVGGGPRKLVECRKQLEEVMAML